MACAADSSGTPGSDDEDDDNSNSSSGDDSSTSSSGGSTSSSGGSTSSSGDSEASSAHAGGIRGGATHRAASANDEDGPEKGHPATPSSPSCKDGDARGDGEAGECGSEYVSTGYF